MPCDNLKCIEFLSSPESREDISKGSMTCKVLKKSIIINGMKKLKLNLMVGKCL